jgi:galactokinase
MTTGAPEAIDRARLTARLGALTGPAVDPSAIRVVRAPGRVNLIGEHTDYNDGYVLPAAIDLEIAIGFVPTDDGRATVTLDATGTTDTVDVRDVGPAQGAWTDYVAGTAREMSLAGLGVTAFRGVLVSTLPEGAGLSSSAALELASAWAMSPPGGPRLPALEVARIAQRAENRYVGMMCGLMDQFASACGVAGAAVMLDCRTLDNRPVLLPDGLVICVIHSGVPRTLVTSAYNDRRADCERAVAIVQQLHPDVRALRDVDLDMLGRAGDQMDGLAAMRARHIIEENDRVLRTVEAFAAGDIRAVGELFAASHASLRDLFEVSCPELDMLVEIATGTPGVVAARMTGAGFGGCIVALARPDAVDDLWARVEREYPGPTGRTPRMWRVRAVAGAGELGA